MKYSISGDNIKVLDPNKESPIATICGDIKTEYISGKKIYLITRIDGKEFDGSEKLDDGTFHSEEVKPKNLHEIIEHEINIFSLFQTIPESNMFDEFVYSLSKDKKQIIVEPIFDEHRVNMEFETDEEDHPLIMGLTVSKHKVGKLKH